MEGHLPGVVPRGDVLHLVRERVQAIRVGRRRLGVLAFAGLALQVCDLASQGRKEVLKKNNRNF